MKLKFTVLENRKILVQSYKNFVGDRISIVEPDKEECDLISEWIDTNKAGYRLSWDTWKLKSDQHLTLFLLYFSSST